jgi:hypothetical protein
MNNRFTCTLTIALILSIQGFYAVAQNLSVNPTTQNWSEIDMLGRLGNHWKWQTDIQYSRQSPYENLDFLKYNEQLTLRAWLHYYLKPTIKLSGFAGLWYNYAISEVGAREFPEYRTAIQFQTYKFWGRNMMTNRIRSEFREIKDIHDHFELVIRGRYLLKFQHLFNSEVYERNAWYGILFDEVFLNGGSEVTGYKPFDQNRVFAGVGYYITDNISLETGYFNQFVHHAHNTNFDSNHIWQISLIFDNITK